MASPIPPNPPILKGAAPVNQLPAAQKVLQGQSLRLKGLRVSDSDAGDSPMSVTLLVSQGTLQVDAAGVTLSYGLEGRQVTLSGSQSAINAALGELTYTPASAFRGADTLTMTSSDLGSTSGVIQTDTDSLAITVMPVNQAPTASHRDITLQEDAKRVLSAADFGFTDVDRNNLAGVKILSLPSNGTFLLKGKAISASTIKQGLEVSAADLNKGNLVFVPAKDANGEGYASFQFQVRDNGGTSNGGRDTSDVYTASVHVLAVNDGPSAGNDSNLATRLQSARGHVLANDSDPERDILNVSGIGLGAESTKVQSLQTIAAGTTAQLVGKYGTLHIAADGSYTYDVDVNSSGYRSMKGGSAIENFTYELSDGQGGKDKATLAIKVAVPNLAPVAQDDSSLVRSNTVSARALANDKDPEGDKLTVIRVGAGSESGNAGTNSESQNPLQALTTGLKIEGRYGRLSMKSDGSYSYFTDNQREDFMALAKGETATDTFTYEVSDGRGSVDRASIRVVVTGENDNPVAVADEGFERRLGNVLHNATGTDYDIDGDRLVVSKVGLGTSASKLVLNVENTAPTVVKGKFGELQIKANGDYRYIVDRENPDFQLLDPAALYNEVFSYEISDGKSGSAKSQLTVTFRGPNTPPEASDDSLLGRLGDVMVNDSDLDDDELHVRSVSAGTESALEAQEALGTTVPEGESGGVVEGIYGTLTLHQDGSYAYQINRQDTDFLALTGSAVESFTYEVMDTKEGTDRATLSFQIDKQATTPTLALNTDIGVDDVARTFSDLVTADPLLKISGLDADATWEYRIDDGEWLAGSGSSLTLQEGTHDYQVRQTDVAENQAVSEVFTTRYIDQPSSLGFALVGPESQALRGIATASAQSRIEVTSDADTLSWQYRMDNTGDWITGDAFVDGKAYITLMEGQHLYQTRKMDAVGNVLNQQQRFILDTVANPLSLELKDPTAPGVTSEPLATISGLEGRAEFQMRVDDQPEWSSIPLDRLQFKLQTGTHTYYLRQIDVAGNVSEVSEFTATYVSAIPQPVVRLREDSGTTDGVTNVAVVEVDGLEPGASWEYQIDGIDGPWLAGNAAGTIAMVNDGQPHSYAVRQKVGGKYSEPGELFNVVLDQFAPDGLTVSLNADSGDSDTDHITKDPIVNIGGLEAGASLEISMDGGEWISQGVTGTETTLSLTEGTHSYRFRQTDKAGNTSTIVTREYTWLDAASAAPTLALETDSNIEDGITNVAKVNVTLAKQGPWQYRVDDGNWQDGTGSSFNAVEGEHSYVVRQSDVAGNSLESTALTVTLDTAGPVFTSATSAGVPYPQQLISTDTVVYTLKATDAGGVRYTMLDNDFFIFDATTGKLTFSQPTGYSFTDSNSYPVTFAATDMAGNISQQTVEINVTLSNDGAPIINLAERRLGSHIFDDFVRLTDAGDGFIYALKEEFNEGTDGRINTNGAAGSYSRNAYNYSVWKLDGFGMPVESFNVGVVSISSAILPELGVSSKGSVFVYSSNKVYKINTESGGLDQNWGQSGQISLDVVGTTPLAFSPQSIPTIGANDEIYALGLQSVNARTAESTRTYNSQGQPVGNYNYPAGSNNGGNFIGQVAAVSTDDYYVFHTYNLVETGFPSLALAHIKNGTLDTNFGTQGFLTLSQTAASPSTLMLDSNDKILASHTISTTSFVIKRFSTSGQPDTSFASGGTLSLSGKMGVMESDGAGGFYFTRLAETVNDRATLGHVKSNGQIDTAFGDNGFVTLSSMNFVTDLQLVDGQINAFGGIRFNTIVQSSSVIRLSSEGDLDTGFGQTALALTEGNRPVGLLVSDGSISDVDAVRIDSYKGFTLKIERDGGANMQDVFGSRGNLELSVDGKAIWEGTEVGTYTNLEGSFQLLLNDQVTQTILDGITHAITYANVSQQPSETVVLSWTVTDNDPAGSKSTTERQTIRIADDMRDAGDALIKTTLGGVAVNFNNHIEINGKHYYLIQKDKSTNGLINHLDLDKVFNGGADTTVSARTVTDEFGTQFVLQTAAEVTALFNDTSVEKADIWDVLKSGDRFFRVWTADLGTNANFHKYFNGLNNPTEGSDITAAYAVVEVIASGDGGTPVIFDPSVKLAEDTGTSNQDFITSKGKLNIFGLETSLPYSYSVDSGLNWVAVGVGGGFSITLAEGVYIPGRIMVKQTDLSGFTTNITNTDQYVIDKTIGKLSLALINDNGYSSTDNITSDGHVLISVAALESGDTWKYTVDGGTNWIDGVGTSAQIALANGVYELNQVRAVVTDVAGNISFKGLQKVVVDNTDGTAPVFISNPVVFFLDRDGTATNSVVSVNASTTVSATDKYSVYYSLGGADAGLFNIDTSTGRLTFKSPTNLINPQGDNYQLILTAADSFNNASTQNLTVKVLDSLRIVSKTIQSANDKLGEGQDQVIKFNQNIKFNPSGNIEINFYGDDDSRITTLLDLTDTSKVEIRGDSLILKGAAFSESGRYYIGINSAIASVDTGSIVSTNSPFSDGIGFAVSTKVEYFEGFASNKAAIVTQIDAATAKLGKDGSAVIVGDLNGDGIDDWATSYTLADPFGRTDAGKIYVAFGRADGITPTLASISGGTGGFVINGAASGDKAGDVIMGAGDVNGDGFADVLIKASAGNGGNGKAYVIYGKSGTSAVDLASVEGGSGGKYYTSNVKNGLAALGDINNDGYADIAHGRGDLTRTTSWTQTTFGATTTYTITSKIIQPANYLGLIDVALDVGVLINSVIDDPFSGLLDVASYVSDELQEEEDEDNPDPVKIAILKDNARVISELSKLPGQSLVDFTVNKTGGGSKYVPKDTVYEVVYTIKKTDIKTTRYTETMFDVGEVQVEYGNGGTQIITGNVNGTGFGDDIAALGDINGDGFADYVVMDQGFADAMPSANIVFGASNQSGFFTSNLASERRGIKFFDPAQSKNYIEGGTLTGLGDINGDGINDFAVSFDSFDNIRTYAVYGKVGLNTVNLSEVASGIGGFLLRAGIASRGSAEVTAIGDYNGDGLDDFAVVQHIGAAGIMQIYYGQATGKTNAIFERVLKSDGFEILGSGFDGFDRTNQVSAGDINGDGLTDLMVRTRDNGNVTILYGSSVTSLDARILSDNTGTAAADTLTATGGDLVLGLAGNDTITVSGANVVQGGLGNDRILIDSSFVTALQSKLGAGGNNGLLAKVDGGAGIDTLQLIGSANLDLTQVSNKMIDSDNISGRLDNIEIIDLGHDATANTLNIRLADVLEMGNKNVFNTGSGWANVTGSALSGSVNQTQLVVAGSNADTVQLKSGEWTLSGNTVKDLGSNEVYKVYVANGSSAHLYIDADVKVI